jgi:hypothetical protein
MPYNEEQKKEYQREYMRKKRSNKNDEMLDPVRPEDVRPDLPKEIIASIMQTVDYLKKIGNDKAVPIEERIENARRYQKWRRSEGLTHAKPENLHTWISGKRYEFIEVPEGCKVLSDGQIWRPNNNGYHDLTLSDVK